MFKRTTNLKQNMQHRSATIASPNASTTTRMLSVSYTIANPANICVESIDWRPRCHQRIQLISASDNFVIWKRDGREENGRHHGKRYIIVTVFAEQPSIVSKSNWAIKPNNICEYCNFLEVSVDTSMSQKTSRKEMRACNREFSCSARNRLFSYSVAWCSSTSTKVG